jgi:hypothetical protein
MRRPLSDAERGGDDSAHMAGWVRTEQAAAYVEYVTRTGLSAYKKTPGNLGARCGRMTSATAGQRS